MAMTEHGSNDGVYLYQLLQIYLTSDSVFTQATNAPSESPFLALVLFGLRRVTH